MSWQLSAISSCRLSCRRTYGHSSHTLFCFAVDGGSLSSAAKQQFVTVQAVPKGISELEAEVGTPLLIRSNHGVKPTAVGQGFYNRARRILDSFNEPEAFSDRVTTQHSRERLLLSFCAPPF